MITVQYQIKKEITVSDKENLPDEVRLAIPKAVLKLTSGSVTWIPQEKLQGSMELWVESSWNMAKKLGLSPSDYVEWMHLGHWNLAGSREDSDMVSSYTSLAGRESWALKKANISIDSAIEMSMEEGLDTVIENTKIMMGLTGLHSNKPDDGPVAPEPEIKDYRIDFS